jgi:hypothetical protein
VGTPGRIAVTAIAVLAIGLATGATFYGVYRRSQRAARESAAQEAYFPLGLDGDLVYKISKQVTRRVMDDAKPSMATVEDAYFTRLRIRKGSESGSAFASRSEKCGSLALALSTLSTSREERLVVEDGAVRMLRKAGPLLLVPLLTALAPQSFSLAFGSTGQGEWFYGWPFVEEVGMSREETELFNEPGYDRHLLFNPLREESITFFQARGSDRIQVGARSIPMLRVDYSGQLTKEHVFHRMQGAMWLGSGLGVLKEQRDVLVKVHPRPVWDEEKKVFHYPSRAVVQYEARMTKLLVHPIQGG